MDLDQIKTLTDELAARFGVQPPHIEPKNLPKWWPDGVLPLLRQGQPIIKVETARNDHLTPAELEGTLACAVVLLDLRRTGRRKFLAARWLLRLIAIILSAVGGWFAAAYDIPWSLAALTAMVAYSIAALTQTGMRARRITYQMDRRVTEVMGRPFMDMMLDLDSRQRSQIRGLVGILIKIAPSEARRTKRLNTTKPRTQQTITR